jgi:hypothetical protein
MVLVSNYLFVGADKSLNLVLQAILDTLIQFKSRLKFPDRLFLNLDSFAYLTGMDQKFDESINSARLELNCFEEVGLIKSHKVRNNKMYQLDTQFHILSELQNTYFKYFGIDQVIEKLGDVEVVYLMRDLAQGLDSKLVDVTQI